MKLKKLLLVCMAFVCVFCVVGCDHTKDETLSGKASYLSGETLTDSSVIRWIGRTEYSQEEEAVYTYYTATGFTVNFTGTALYVTYNATNTNSNMHRPYFLAMVDGETASEGTSFCLTKAKQTVKVVSGLASGNHTVTVLKRSEPENSLTSISEIYTDGKFLKPNEHTGLRVQVIGSSGITGHGCLGSSGDAWTTENSSPFSSFGYLAAEQFGAECQFVSASAMGLVWGYHGVDTLTNAYEAVGLISRSYNASSGRTTSETCTTSKWNHSSWEPNIVIANIGGNDWNSHISKLSGTARSEAETEFKNAVKTLLTRINSLYPNAVVIWTVNSTSSGNGALAYTAIQDLSFKSRVKTVAFVDTSKNGADDHADVTAHTNNATAIVSAIKTFGFKTK